MYKYVLIDIYIYTYTHTHSHTHAHTHRFEILIAPFWGEVKYGVTGATKDKGYTLFVLQRKPGQS